MAESLLPCDYVYPDSGTLCRLTPTRLYVVEIEDADGVEIQYLGHRCGLHAPRGPNDQPPSHPEPEGGATVRRRSDANRGEGVPLVDPTDVDEPRALLIDAAR